MAAIFVVLGTIGYVAWIRTHPADDPSAKLITAQVSRGELIESVSATGSVTAQTGAMVKIGSQITGRIKHLNADVGSNVKAGQVIAELDLPDIDAQLKQAEANLGLARTKLMQQQSGLGMQRTQTSSNVSQAQADLRGAEARLESAEAAAQLQTSQQPTEIRRAETALATAQAALSTAKSNQKQVQASANLQVANAQEQLNQAKANARNSTSNLTRQQALLKKGFVSAAVVDDAIANDSVNQSLVQSAQQSLQLVKEKVAADLLSARDLVTEAEQQVESAKASLASAQAGTHQTAVKLADVNNAREQVNLSRAALKSALGNRAQDTLKDQDIRQADDTVKASQSQVDYWRAQLDKTFIRSPISGTVLQLAAQQGETLAAGLSAPTLIIVADLTRLQVDVFVDETDIGKVKLGQEASVTVDAFPLHAFRGKVMKIASGSTIQQGVVTYDVAVEIEDTKRQLKPDMTASVNIQTGRRPDVLLVPSEAVKAGADGTSVSVVVKKDGKTDTVHRRVTVGGSDGVNTEIVDGLKEGETIVLAGMDDGRKKRGPESPFGPSNKDKKKKS